MLESAAGYESRSGGLIGVIAGLLENPALDITLREHLSDVRTALSHDPSMPFLSVLLRTQGRRLEPLRDALLCLASQTDGDFEVILLDHDAVDESARHVRSIVDSQPDEFRARISVLEVSGGTRAAPLNVGVKAARGQYIAVFDDDDLVLGNWVEAFRTSADTASGQLMRAVVATQVVRPEVWAGKRAGFRALDWPQAAYAAAFDQFEHLQVNHSPFMSWAFPRFLFTKLGLEFDEQLTVCEDWDVILRGSLLLGVTSIPLLTAIYRRWDGAASSYTVHSSELWRASEARVVAKLDEGALILPPDSASRIRLLLARDPSAAEVMRMRQTLSWKITSPLRRARPLLGRLRRAMSRIPQRRTR